MSRRITVLKERISELRPDLPAPGSRVADQLCRRGSWCSATSGSPRSSCRSGFGQIRTAKQLPGVDHGLGYYRWLSARLIPSRAAEDLFAG